ncbi:MAG: hypothetical protein ABEL76_01920 [Bradymonadaceae bacterium]
MSAHLNLELEADPPVVALGEPIEGRVEIEAPHDVDLQEMTIKATWRVSGRGQERRNEQVSATVDRSDAVPGVPHTYAFTLEGGVSGPCSYDGEHLTVDWKLEARAETARLGTLVSRPVEVDVTAGPVEAYRYGDPEVPDRGMTEGVETGHAAARSTMILLLAALTSYGAWYVNTHHPSATWNEGGALWWPGPCLGTVAMFLVLGAFADLFLKLSPHVTRALYGRPTVHLGSDEVSGGDDVEAVVDLTDVSGDAATVEARLEARERVQSYGRYSGGRSRATVHTGETVSKRVIGDSDGTARLELETPTDGPWSVRAPMMALFWIVHVTIRLDSGPEWTHEKVFLLRPPGASPAES